MLAACGIRPWEFGELTHPQLLNILRRGKPAAASDADRLAARRALALARSHRWED